MNYDLNAIRAVIGQWKDFCISQAGEGVKIQDREIADIAYSRIEKEAARKTAYSRFCNRVLYGNQELRVDELLRVLAAWRKRAEDLTAISLGVEPHDQKVWKTVDEAESLICSELHLPDIPIEPGHFALHDDRTRSLHYHQKMRASMHDAASMWIHDYARVADPFAKICIQTKLCPAEAPPDSANLPSGMVLEDSLTFDNTDWRPVQDKNDLQRRPIQPTYCTRVLRLKPEVRSAAVQFNTGGFGIFPLPSPKGTPQWKRACATKSVAMHEAGGLTRTTYLEFEFPDDGHVREIIAHVIFFNGVQDQLHRHDAQGRPWPVDWHGKRVYADTQKANIAVILPAKRHIDCGEFVRRPDSLKRDIVEEADDDRRIFETAMTKFGTVVEETKAIWMLPAVTETTVFSFRWTWARDIRAMLRNNT